MLRFVPGGTDYRHALKNPEMGERMCHEEFHDADDNNADVYGLCGCYSAHAQEKESYRKPVSRPLSSSTR